MFGATSFYVLCGLRTSSVMPNLCAVGRFCEIRWFKLVGINCPRHLRCYFLATWARSTGPVGAS
eukprot:1191099-Prorocentrum_minimum.AAC.8